jgi:hypothetical protein
LTASFGAGDTTEEESATNSIYVGQVEYIDHDRADVPRDHGLRPYFLKRRSFEFEHELRAVVALIPDPPFEKALDVAEFGIYVPVAIDVLIEEVRVSPNAQHWFADLVTSVCDHYGLDVPVKQSDLSRDPIY